MNGADNTSTIDQTKWQKSEMTKHYVIYDVIQLEDIL